MIKIKRSKGGLVVGFEKPSLLSIEISGLCGIVFLAIYCLSVSWRKWCDPQIDYGRELYIPWRIAEGAKWLKDVDDLYGPLSRFIDAGLFKIFGPGIMVLAWANIAIYFVILTLVYILFKRAWGVVASLTASFVFIGVFSFSQLTITSNYNYVTPYSQQVTHGFLFCLILVWLIPKWVDSTTTIRSFFVGLLMGLSAVLKPEFVLASILLLGTAFFYRIRLYGIPKLLTICSGIMGCMLPTVVFYIYFITYMPLKKAVLSACYAWLNGVFIWKDELTAHLLNNFSGMDQPWAHLINHVVATGWVLLIIITIAFLAHLTGMLRILEAKIGMAIIIVLFVIVMGLKCIVWVNVGQSLLGLLLVYGIYRIYRLLVFKGGYNSYFSSIHSTLLWVLATALITRMVLNGRIFQYGFIQAALGALVIVAVLIEDLPRFLKLNDNGKWLVKSGICLLLICGVFVIMGQSKKLEEAKTLEIGHGSDLFYSYTKQVNPDGEIVRNFYEILSKSSAKDTLIVIPEGIMINYLARKKSSLGIQTFYSNRQVEESIVDELKIKSPNWVIFMSRDLTEYGVSKFGAHGQCGEIIVNFLNKYYTKYQTIGQDPIQGTGSGGILYQLAK